MFDSDGVKGPGVKILRNILSEQEAWFPEYHEPAERASAERARLQQAGEHVTGESGAGSVSAAKSSGVGAADVRVNLVVRRCDVELAITPKCIRGQKHSVRGSSRSSLSQRCPAQNQHQKIELPHLLPPHHKD